MQETATHLDVMTSRLNDFKNTDKRKGVIGYDKCKIG